MSINTEFLTELDCTREDVRVQAKWELDRADAVGALASWARKWGRPMIAGCEGAPDLTDDLKEAEAEAERAENQASALSSAIEQAVKLLDLIPTCRDEIDAIVIILEADL